MKKSPSAPVAAATGIDAILHWQNRSLAALAGHAANPASSLLAKAPGPQARLWLQNPSNRPLLASISDLPDKACQQLLADEAFFTQMNHPKAAQLSQAQQLLLLLNPGARTLFAQQASLFTHKALQQALQQPDWVAALNQQQQALSFDHPLFAEIFAKAEFQQALSQPHSLSNWVTAGTLAKVHQVINEQPQLINHWPKWLNSQHPPRLGYWDAGNYTEINNQRRSLLEEFPLVIDTPKAAQLQQALTRGMINTLVLPVFGNVLEEDALYSHFLALGGRIISNIDTDNLRLINALCGWSLKYKTYYKSGALSSPLNLAASIIKEETCCMKRDSLPSNAQVFLHKADDPQQVAGVYIPYGFGEVMLIGYEWETGSDTEWDAVLHGLIQGTALPFQRTYLTPSL